MLDGWDEFENRFPRSREVDGREYFVEWLTVTPRQKMEEAERYKDGGPVGSTRFVGGTRRKSTG